MMFIQSAYSSMRRFFSGALKSTIRKLSKFYLYLDSDVDSLLNSLFALFTITCSSSNNNFIFIIIIIIIIIIYFFFLTNHAMSCARVLELCLHRGFSTVKWNLRYRSKSQYPIHRKVTDLKPITSPIKKLKNLNQSQAEMLGKETPGREHNFPIKLHPGIERPVIESP